MKHALITGIAGFVGSHLAEHLRGLGWEVAGLELPGVPRDTLAGIDGLRVEEADILDPVAVAGVVASSRPDAVFHLAAVTFVPAAEKAPCVALDVNAGGTLNVLEACRRHAPAARVVVVSSSEVYGKVPPGEISITELRAPAPANIYALSKLCAEESARCYGRAYGVPVVILRPFNHIGPRQSPAFVTSTFARQIAEIEVGVKQPVIDVGNLNAERDFTDVRDMVRAYALAGERCASGETYNICTGRPRRIADVLRMLLALSSARIEVRQDPARLRRSDVPVFYGDCAKFAGATGWKPEHAIEETLRGILDWWRGRVMTLGS